MDILSRSCEGTKFKGYTLHAFQEEAIKHVEKDKSVIVSTHTGNGKTLIAEAGIVSCINEGKRIIYTAPIKALSNQKLKQFSQENEQVYINEKYHSLKEQYGDTFVGLVTGDRTINPEAPIVLMTTEVLCNMLYDAPDRLEDSVKYIVFDEIHNLSDPERGTIWEETIILKPKNCKIIGLSATVPNSKELCEWIGSLDEEKVYDVTYKERLTPLTYSYFHKDYGVCTHEELKNKFKAIPQDQRTFTSHMNFMRYAEKNDLLNVLGFFGSRRKCEGFAQELSTEFDFLDKDAKRQVEVILYNYNSNYPELSSINSWKIFEQTARNGICFYHSGLVPLMKDACEEILNKGIAKVCYGTDAISQGVNLAFKTVFMDNLTDGYTKETISGATFKQRAGRAGRKGFDESGNVFVLGNIYEEQIVDLSKIDGENVVSRLHLPFNRVLKHSQKNIDTFLDKSFTKFQYENSIKQLNKHVDVMNSKLSHEEKQIAQNNTCNKYNKPACPITNKELRNDLEILNYELKKCESDEERKQLTRIIKTVDEFLHESLYPFKCCNTKPCIKERQKLKNIEYEISRTQNAILENINNDPIVDLKNEYDNKIALLKHLNYIDDDKNLLYRGKICSSIYIEELLVSELIEKGLFHNFDVDTINALLGGIVYEKNKKVQSELPKEIDTEFVDKTVLEIRGQAEKFNLEYVPNFNPKVCDLVYNWSTGKELSTITDNSDLFEGDFINICKNLVQLLSQVKSACLEDKYISSKADKCISKIRRGIVDLSF